MQFPTSVIAPLSLYIPLSSAFAGEMRIFDSEGFGGNVPVVTLSKWHDGNCGTIVAIHLNEKTTYAAVANSCVRCGPDDIDLARTLYEQIGGDLETGRSQVTWNSFGQVKPKNQTATKIGCEGGKDTHFEKKILRIGYF